MAAPVAARARRPGAADDGGPFAEVQDRPGDDPGALVEAVDRVASAIGSHVFETDGAQLVAGPGEGEIAVLILDPDVEPSRQVGRPALAVRAGPGSTLVDEIDDAEDPSPPAATDGTPARAHQARGPFANRAAAGRCYQRFTAP